MVISEDNQKINKPRATAKPRAEMLTIAPGDLTYAELLKGVRENIAPEDLGVRILQAKKTETGELQLRVKGKASQISDILNSKMPGIETKIKRSLTTMHIRDLEEDVTDREILQGIQKALPGLPDNVAIVKSIRPAYNNTCRATLQLPQEWANQLHARRHVQVGLVSARIRLRIEETKCSRCWDPGHNARDCTGEDMRNRCFGCREVGHQKAQCPKMTMTQINKK